MTKQLIRLIVTVAGVIGLGLILFLVMFMRPLTVQVIEPGDNVPVKVFGLGTVEARVLSKIGFEVGAALVELNADHGDRVSKGDVLARLHSAEQEARVARSAAGIVNARAALRMAEAAVGRTRAVLAQKRHANKRKQTLLKQQTVSIEVAEEAQMEEDVAAAELTVALSEVDVARAALEDAQAQYEYERVLLDHHTLTAPFDAIVIARHHEPGSVLSSGEPLFTLVAPETVWALAHVDEARAGGIRVGQAAEVRLRSLPTLTIKGHVARIDIESDRVSEERRVYIVCDQCPERFHLGEQAEVFITIGTIDRALLVPETAVEDFDGTRGRVWTVENGELHRRTVTFGHRTLDSRLEIVGGLPEAAGVVGKRRSGLREGRRVKVTTGVSF